jgi:hypothetical protein
MLGFLFIIGVIIATFGWYQTSCNRKVLGWVLCVLGLIIGLIGITVISIDYTGGVLLAFIYVGIFCGMFGWMNISDGRKILGIILLVGAVILIVIGFPALPAFIIMMLNSE